MNKTVSIIVPVYNCAPYLPKCLTSLGEQTYGNVQIIIIDDGSTDESSVICDEYAAKYKTFEVIHKENAGVSSARNDGIDTAKGDYIMFLDGDDYLSTTITEDLVNSLEEYNSDIATISASTTVIEDDSPMNSLMSNRPIKLEDGVYSAFEICREYLEREPLLTSVVWGKIFRKELFSGVRFTVGKGFEDTLILPEIYLRAHSVSVIHGDYYYYVQRASSVMHTGYTPKKYCDFLDSRIYKISAFYNKGLKKANYNFERTIFDIYMTYFKEKIKSLTGDEKISAAALYNERLDWFAKQEWFIHGGRTTLISH